MRHADGKSIILWVFVGLWIAAGGFLFGDAQPSAQAGLLCGRYCVSAGQCPPERGGCICTSPGAPPNSFGLCYQTSISWGLCWSGGQCQGLTAGGTWCYCFTSVDLACWY
jgi:hypothetical protein